MSLPVCALADLPKRETDPIRLALAQERLLRAVMERFEFRPETLGRGIRILCDSVADADPEKGYLDRTREYVLAGILAEQGRAERRVAAVADAAMDQWRKDPAKLPAALRVLCANAASHDEEE